MKHIKTFESFLTEGKSENLSESTLPNKEQQKVIDTLTKELSWNVPQMHPATPEDVKIYSSSKIKMTTSNAIVYWGMAGQSIVKDIQKALDAAGIKAKVFRGYEVDRRTDSHDYVIVLGY